MSFQTADRSTGQASSAGRMPAKESPRTSAPVDVLLLQLGTPEAPTPAALRRYLRQFLGDPRVLELPAAARWALVNLIIVPRRAAQSAAKYARIWNDEAGSPLLDITRRQTAALQQALGEGFRIHFAMRYGRPAVSALVRRLMSDGCERLLLLPMYPQYSASTTASGMDAVFAALQTERVWPAIRFLRDYYTDAGYIEAVAQTIERAERAAAAEGCAPQRYLLSFHGLPAAYVAKGDPYQAQAEETARRIARRLGWSQEQWRVTYQSRFGRQEWLRPYTDETLVELARAGVRRVLLANPGFTADCLETIDEIGREAAEEFRRAGGERLIRAACVNDDPAFIDALAQLVRRESAAWL